MLNSRCTASSQEGAYTHFSEDSTCPNAFLHFGYDQHAHNAIILLVGTRMSPSKSNNFKKSGGEGDSFPKCLALDYNRTVIL